MSAFIVTVSEESEVFFAETKDDAWNQWRSDNACCDDCTIDNCDCYCSREVERAPIFDEYENKQSIPAEAYFKAGWAMRCVSCDGASYCGSEPCDPGDWSPVDGVALCVECADYQNRQKALANDGSVTHWRPLPAGPSEGDGR